MEQVNNKINALKITVVKFVIIFSLIIVAANTIILAFRGYQSYYRIIEDAKLDIDRFTRNISDHIELTFIAVDVLLKRAVEKHHSNLLFGNSLRQDTHNNIISWVNETPQISAMLMTDENGQVTEIYRKPGFKTWMEGYDNVDTQAFFTKHVDEIDDIFIGYQKSFLRDNSGFVILSRRLNKLDGSFDGVIMAAVNVDYVSTFFESLEQNKQTKLILRHSDGNFLITPKELNPKNEKIEISNGLRDIFSASENRKDKVYIRKIDKAYDGKLRIYSFYELSNMPLQISLIFFGTDILNAWKSERFSDLVFYVIFLLFVVIVAFFSIELAKKVHKLRISEARALAASKAKSDFLANMSHELRTPLNAIIGFSEMLFEQYFGEVNAKQKERLKDIHSCGNHLLSVINDVLEFSKGQAGKMEINPEMVTMKRLIDETVRIFEDRAEIQGVTMVVSVADDVPVIFIDKRKIKQVLINLISNSLKFTERSGLVEIRTEISDKKEVVISVRDTGAGMDELDIPKALSAFGQVHKDSTKGGTGLGLPLCKIFVELHGGELIIKSKKNVGTTVTVILPNSVILMANEP
ncbi:MAG TPA: hypothetical protein DIV86_00975 [Alphaproteobacteria bacterium]|nr:hypothetical protein [Alphaproteobacteria bacterium]